jgi:hypothetical protein
MNAADRKRAEGIANRISAVQLALEDLFSELDGMADDEESKFENMPEGLQSSDRGQVMEQAKDALRQAADSLEQVSGDLDDVVSSINEAVQS